MHKGTGRTRAFLPYAAPIIVGALLLALFVMNSYGSGSVDNTEPTVIVRPIESIDHVRGNADAPIELVVYSDPECPYCGLLHNETLPRLEEEYAGEIKVVYRHFFLPRFQGSRLEAAASECAAQLGGENSFWQYISEMYARDAGASPERTDDLVDLAGRLGVARDAFESCLISGEMKERIERDHIDGAAAGINIMPSTVVRKGNYTLLVTGSSYGRLAAAIELARARK